MSALTLCAFLIVSSALYADGLEKNKPVTFTKDIAPILQAKCQECHHPGTPAPMSLITYEDTRPWAGVIKERVQTRQMPPWHLDKTVGIQKFANDRSLTDEQINTIARWVDSGAPEGDLKDMPPAKTWPDHMEWQLAKQFGPPDIVIESAPYTVAAEGQDVWWRPVTAIPLTETRWVRAVEMRPGTVAGAKVTHHALAQLEQVEPAAADASATPAADHPGMGGPGLLMEWAIGKNFDIYRPNTGKLLLPGAKIRWEVHYHSVGEAIRDHVELAIYLYPKGETPKYRTRLFAFQSSAGPEGLDIPPNSYAQTQSFAVLSQPARLENFQPHMHLRGKAMSMEAILPDGTTRMLSYVDHFNFNWMNNYIYTDDAAPVLPKGTVLRFTAWYDNTANNPTNPDPNQWVGWGDRTIDEMGHAWVNVTYISEDDYKAWLASHNAGHMPSMTEGGAADAH
ncbi:MAG TPA: hypothetical protein VJO53_07980 [Candidatus Acidoferrales bacterium]|nr:hypothetical protein [Candidatus Acidoferrales bacterium]